MQSWIDIKTKVVNACGDILSSHGYRFVKSRSSYETTIATGRLSVILTLISSDVGNRFARIGCGVRNSAVEKQTRRRYVCSNLEFSGAGSLSFLR